MELHCEAASHLGIFDFSVPICFCSQLDSYENIIWDKPYTHAAAYVVGAWLGYLLHSQHDQQVRMTRVSQISVIAKNIGQYREKLSNECPCCAHCSWHFITGVLFARNYW